MNHVCRKKGGLALAAIRGPACHRLSSTAFAASGTGAEGACPLFPVAAKSLQHCCKRCGPTPGQAAARHRPSSAACAASGTGPAGAEPTIATVAGYAGFGGFYFLVSALLLLRAARKLRTN